ncbi:hypothetical protein CVT26_005504 [Gymnopilus dilepis]|uniref:Uncharacterized protein n=1 Tax=Gymnopilus dilepis TaxID=231916 RepID=A0A409WJQ1_9AGAR|nr:hypothetical protein CVT26_005504 [Gymnopilus dilepis]
MSPSPAPSSRSSASYSDSSREPFTGDSSFGKGRRRSPRIGANNSKSGGIVHNSGRGLCRLRNVSTGGITKDKEAMCEHVQTARTSLPVSQWKVRSAAFQHPRVPTVPSCVQRAIETGASRSSGSSHKGMNTDPIIMLSVYCNETTHSKASICVLEGLLDGLFRAKESHLLNFTLPFTDLAKRQEIKQLQAFNSLMRDFLGSRTNCRFVLLLQTHADPISGDLLFGPNKVTSLDMILRQLLTLPPTGCGNSILLLNSCGGFIKHNKDKLPHIATEFGFNAIFGLTGHSVDPLLVSKSLFYNIIDLHLVGGESLQKVLQRSANTELLSHTSITAYIQGSVYTLVGASLRHRPNGVPICCPQCEQPASFVSLSCNNTIAKFRCRQLFHDPHSSPRHWKETLLLSDDTRVVGELNGCRYIMAKESMPKELE